MQTDKYCKSDRNCIKELIKLLSRLPGFGKRSARRAALAIVSDHQGLLSELYGITKEVLDKIVECEICHNLDQINPCSICQRNNDSSNKLVVVESVGDIWALENLEGMDEAAFHVLGGTLSPLDGIEPEDLNFSTLLTRLNNSYKEVILAISANVNGQTTMHYLYDILQTKEVSVTKLARGLPVGGELDYLDKVTLEQAFKDRSALDD